FVDEEVLVAINTDETQPLTAYSAVAPTFRVEGDRFHLVFWHAPRPAEQPPGELREERKAGRLVVRLTLPPAGFVVYQASLGLHRLGASPALDLQPWPNGSSKPTRS